MEKKVQLRFAAVNKETFDNILNGSKKVETRAASPKFKDLKPGDIVVLVCGGQKAEKTIKKVQTFKSIKDLIAVYPIGDINPGMETYEELEKTYYSYPNYKEKIIKFGLIAMEFE